MAKTAAKKTVKGTVKAKTVEEVVVPVVPTKEMTTKRFVIRKTLIGQNVVISFENHKKQVQVYNHDKVYNQLKEKFDGMNCFNKYGSYTNSKDLPRFVRELKEIV